MRARRFLLLLTRVAVLTLLPPATLLVVGCGAYTSWSSPATAPASPGILIEFGKVAIYFTPGVQEDEARKVGALLMKRFGNHGAIAQVRYQNRRYEVRFVVRAGAEDTTSMQSWRALGESISKECFWTSPVDIHLTDEHLRTLRTVPYEPIKPVLPVEVTFRSSIGGGSLVAQYRNTSAKYLTVSVALRNTTLDQAKSAVLNIGPNRVTEHGWAEGWSYMSGETITITHADYEVLELRVP